MISEQTLREIRMESINQDDKWGEQNHDPAMWLAILTEEVGELAQAILAFTFGAKHHSSHSKSMQIEATQVAAVAGHFIENLKRMILKWEEES